MSNRWAVNIFFFINGFIFANWAARLPRIQSDYTIDDGTIGLILLAHAIGAVIAMPITGWMISLFGSRRISIASALLFVFFFALIPLSLNYWILFIPFFLMGASTGIMDVAMNAQAVLVEQKLQKPVMTMFHALFSIGMVIGGLSGVLFTSLNSNLLTHFLVVGVVGTLILVSAFSFLIRDYNQSIDEQKISFVWPRGPIIGLGFIAFCCMMGEGAMSDWSTNYMKNIIGATKEVQGFGLTAFAAMMTTGRLFGDKGRLKFGDRIMMISGSCISLLGMFCILGLLNPNVAILGFGLVGFGLSNIVPIVYSLAGSFPGIAPGVGIAMSTTIGYSGFMIGPPIIGFFADIYGLRLALLFLTILFFIMLILVFKYRPALST